MEYATLNNGVKMPMAGIGTFLLTPDEAEASCVSALQNGYRLIDTANAYCNEKAVGRAMKKSGLLREKIFLETKLWPTFYTDADAVDKTLARLDTDYIDLLLIHQPAAHRPVHHRLLPGRQPPASCSSMRSMPSVRSATAAISVATTSVSRL